MLKSKPLLHALSLFKHGSFTRAAAESHISQSAFSRSIHSLEKTLGVKLFDRNANHVEPTAYGKVLLRRASIIVENTEELEREVHLLKDLSIGNLSVAFGIYPAELSGNKAVGKTILNYPDLRYQVTTGNWLTVNQLVLSRTVDIGFATTSTVEKDERLLIREVCEHEVFLYCRSGHPLKNHKTLNQSDLDNYPFVSIQVPSGLINRVPGKNEIDAITGNILPSIEINDFTSARTIIAHSNSIGAAIPVQIESQLKSGEFMLLDYQRPWLEPSFGFILLRNRSMNPATEVFMQHVIDIEKTLSQKNRVLINQYLR